MKVSRGEKKSPENECLGCNEMKIFYVSVSSILSVFHCPSTNRQVRGRLDSSRAFPRARLRRPGSVSRVRGE